MSSVLELCSGLPEQTFEAGQDLFVEGTPGGRLFVLAEGTVSIRRGGTVVTSLSEPGSFLGETSVLLATAHTATVAATEPTRVYVIEDAAGTLAARPELCLAAARQLAVRLNAVTGYLADIHRQYGGEAGHLGLMQQVLSELMTVRRSEVEPGSARDVPEY